MDDENEPKTVDRQDGFGFFFQVTDQALFESLEQRAASKKYFTDRVTSARVTVRLSDIALAISPSERLAFVSLVRPTRAGTTGTRGFRAYGPITMDIAADQLIEAAGKHYEQEIRKGYSEPSFRPSLNAWNAIWLAIKKLCPDLAAALAKIDGQRFDESFSFDEETDDEQVFYEKDAVGVALDIAGISFGGIFAELSQGRTEEKSLLEALCGNPIEDVFIDHDSHIFPSYILQSDHLQACNFAQGNRKLQIFNVNRRPAERALGVDLIYHNLTYDAFTFVQYKMFEREGRNGIWRYRPNKQFNDEVSRMQAAREQFGTTPPTTANRFRLGNDPFFFKLCRRQHLKVNSGQLASGAYLSLTHCELILAEGQKALEAGSNVSRWFNRTQFTDMVAKGWIGTNTVSDRQLIAYIEEAAKQGKSVIVAIGEARHGSNEEDL